MKMNKTLSLDVYLVSEFDKRGINLTELIHKLLMEHLAFIVEKEELERRKRTQSETL